MAVEDIQYMCNNPLPPNPPHRPPPSPPTSPRSTSQSSLPPSPSSAPAPLPPPPPLAAVSPKRRRLTKKTTPIDAETTAGLEAIAMKEAPAPKEATNTDHSCQYNLRCLPCGVSEDPREILHAAVLTLASHLRDQPTVPANPHQPDEPMTEAFDDDVAELLPPKHCAFKNCTWALRWDSFSQFPSERAREHALIDHVRESHGA